MTEGPYRGHVPAKPYTLADTLRGYTKYARETLELELRAKAATLWPALVEELREQAKQGASGKTFDDGEYKGVALGYFKAFIEEAGLELVSPRSFTRYWIISWYKP